MRTRLLAMVTLVALVLVVFSVFYYRASTHLSHVYSWHIRHGTAGKLRSFTLSPSGGVFATSDSFGVYRSGDKGRNWKPVTKGIKKCYCETVAADADGVLYLGTGRGIYRSADGGEHWRLADSGLPTVSVMHLVIDGGNRVYAACRDGRDCSSVYRSEGGGDNWTLIWKGREDGPDARSIAITKKNAIFVGTGYGDLYRSDDDARHWTNLTSKLRLEQHANRASTCIDCIVADHTSRIYISATIIRYSNNRFSQSACILRSDDGGGSWKKATVPPGKPPVCLAAGPDDTMLLGNADGGVFMSRDHGNQWELIQRPSMADRLLRSPSGAPGIIAMVVDKDGDAYAIAYDYMLYGEYQGKQ